MWRALIVATVLSCALTQAEALSFLSMVFYRMMFPKPQPAEPQVTAYLAPPPTPLGQLGRSKSMKEQVNEEMTTGHTPEKMLENLMLTLISTSREIVPNDFDLTDESYDLPVTGKLHLRKGKVSGVRSYGQPTLQSSIDKEGNMVSTVELHFTNLVATFGSIYLDFYGNLFDKQGRGTFRFKKNKFLVKLRVVKKEQIFEKMTKNDCVVFVKSVEVTEISDIAVDIFNDQNRRAFYTSAITDVAIVSLEKMLQEQLTLAITKWMWDLLPDKNAFTCRDTHLRDLIEQITEEQELHMLEEKASDDRLSEQTSQVSSQPPTGVVGSVVNWWKVRPEDKKEDTNIEPVKSDAEGINSNNAQQQGWFWNRWNKKPEDKKDGANTTGPVKLEVEELKNNQQQGWFWNRWNNKSPRKPEEPVKTINVSSDNNNNVVENPPKAEETSFEHKQSGGDTQDNQIQIVPSKQSAHNS